MELSCGWADSTSCALLIERQQQQLPGCEAVLVVEQSRQQQSLPSTPPQQQHQLRKKSSRRRSSNSSQSKLHRLSVTTHPAVSSNLTLPLPTNKLSAQAPQPSTDNSRPCYTVTTWCPSAHVSQEMTLLQQMQEQSRAICAAAAAGAIAAAATIPGGSQGYLVDTHGEGDNNDSMMIEEVQDSDTDTDDSMHLSTGAFPASWRAFMPAHLEPNSTSMIMDQPADMPAQHCFTPLFAELEASTATAQHSVLLKDMRADDLSTKMQARKHARLHGMQQPAEEDASQTPTGAVSNAVKSPLSKISLPATTSGICSNNNNRDHAPGTPDAAAQQRLHPTASNSPGGVQTMSAASPQLNNTSGACLAAGNIAPLPFGSGWSTAACQPQHNSQREPYLHLPAAPFTLGVECLLRPSERQDAAADAMRDAVYAITASHRVHPARANSCAKRLAAEAVAAVRAELAAATQQGVTVPATTEQLPQPGPGFSNTNIFNAAPFPVLTLAPSVQPQAAVASAFATPAADDHFAQQQQQQQQYEQQVSQGFGGSSDQHHPDAAHCIVANTFASAATLTTNSWVVGAFGLAGNTCSHWTQHQQDLAASYCAALNPQAYAAAGGGCAPTDAFAALQYNPALYAPYQATGGAGFDAAASDGEYTVSELVGYNCCFYYPQPVPGLEPCYIYPSEEELARCARSPQLEGVDCITDKCTIMMFSNTYTAAGSDGAWREEGEEAEEQEADGGEMQPAANRPCYDPASSFPY